MSDDVKGVGNELLPGMCERHTNTPTVVVDGKQVCPKCQVEANTVSIPVYDCPTHGKDVPVFMLTREGQILIGPVCTRCMDTMLKATLPQLTVREETRVVQSAEVDGAAAEQ